MQDAVAFALKADFAGTVEQEIDGELQEVPKFQGGLLYVGDGDIDVGAELEAGDGVIVVDADDQRLRDLLEAYPALKRVDVPAGMAPLSRYDRQPLADLRNLGSLRDIKGAGSISKDRLVAALEAQDAANRKGQASAAAAVAEDPELADDLEALTKPKLVELADKHGVEIASGANKDDIAAALRAAGVAPDTTVEGGEA